MSDKKSTRSNPADVGAHLGQAVEAAGGFARADVDSEGRRPVVQAVRWTVVATLTRQGFQVVGALLLARILGPATYGVISLATLYTVVAALILDQGLAAALIQRPTLPHALPGVVATLNLSLAGTVAATTSLLAPLVETYFAAPPLAGILRILALGLLLKAVVVVPRAMLTRCLDFKLLGKADIAGAILGTTAGVSAALLGVQAYSVVFLTVVSDFAIMGSLLLWGPSYRPNLRFRLLPPVLAFSLRIFATNVIAAFSRNTDNVLVGRYLGVTALSYYAMAYRALVIPVQMVGQTAARFMFPLLAREAHSRVAMAEHLYRCTEVLAAATVPVMIWVACAAEGLVELVLGASWVATAPILSILAVAGARETIFYVTPSLMKATDRAALNLRYEILSTVVQVAGIVIGLQFGLIGVAAGYTIAGFVLTPILMILQHRLAGLRVTRQLRAILPAVACSVAGACGFLLVSRIDMPPLGGLVACSLAYLAVGAAVGLAFPQWRRDLRRLVVRFVSRNRLTPLVPTLDAT